MAFHDGVLRTPAMIILSSIEQELKEAVAQARLATQAALAHLDGATPVEQALIRALEQRY